VLLLLLLLLLLLPVAAPVSWQQVPPQWGS
jgi:hypothetical protein